MFQLDRRSLAVMRICYGALVLVDLAIRSVSFRQHYTEAGAYPLELAFSMGLRPEQFSVHVLSGAIEYQIALFCLHSGIALLLLLGWRTRLMTVLCFVLAVSLQNRNFLILNGGDNWMRVVLFWAMFLPWGDRFSLDSLKDGPARPDKFANIATTALILQTMSVYFVSALYKTGPAWRTEGTAAYLALNQLEWNSDLGTYLLYFPDMLIASTFAVLYFELIGPWLMISPIWTQPLRALSVVGFIAFHLGLALTMELGIFAYVGICTLTGLLPSFLWESGPGRRLERVLVRAISPAPWNAALRGSAGSSQPLTHRVTSWILAPLVFLTLHLNAAGRNSEFLYTHPMIQNFSRLISLDQYWGLFAPEPARRGGWFVMEGILSDGKSVDLSTGQPPDWSAPRSSSIYPTQRIKRWLVGLANDDYKEARPYHARYLFKLWDQTHPNSAEPLVRVRGHYLSRPSLTNYEDPGMPTDYIFMDYTREQLGKVLGRSVDYPRPVTQPIPSPAR